MPSVYCWPADGVDGNEALPGNARATSAEAPDRRRARRSRVAAAFPDESRAQRDRYQSRRRAFVSPGANADLQLLGKRTGQVGALLRGVVAAVISVHSGLGYDFDGEGNRYGPEFVLEYRCALPEVPCYRRSCARPACNGAKLPAGSRTAETGLDGAMDHRSAGHQSGNVDAFGTL